MGNFSHYFTLVLAWGTLLLDIGIVVLLLWWLLQFLRKRQHKNLLCVHSWQWLSAHAGKLAWALAVLATAGSLTYSGIIGFEPCRLCWWQRIFMYPQVILLWSAWRGKLANLRWYSLLMVVIGAAIAKYHYIMQLGWVDAGSCDALGYSSACSQRFVLNFGYITIPMMAATVFAGIAILLLINWWENR